MTHVQMMRKLEAIRVLLTLPVSPSPKTPLDQVIENQYEIAKRLRLLEEGIDSDD